MSFAVLSQFSYRIKDAEGIYANKQMYAVFQSSHSFDDIQAFSDAYAPLLDAITEGEIVNATFRVVLTTSGLKSSPVGDSDVQEDILISFEKNGSFYSYGDVVPAYIDAINVNGRVDLTNTDLAAYTAFAIAAHSGFAMSDSNGFDLVAVKSGVETFRKKRKQLNARSKTIA